MASSSGTNKTCTDAEESEIYDRVATDVYTYGSVSLALALAHETGLVHALYQATSPASSVSMASQTRLKERYVREVLNCLAVAGLVQLEPGTGGGDGNEARYFVSEPHRKQFIHTATNCGFISAGARRFPAVREIFYVDGPSCIRLESTSFDSLDQMGSMETDCLIQTFLMTPGLRQRLESGINAAEVGCGYGLLSRHLAAMFPRSQFTITDAVPEPLEIAKERACRDAATNMTFELLDVCHVPDECVRRFDWIWANDVIHDLPYPVEALKGIHKALKPGGHFSLSDIFFSSYVALNMGQRYAASSYAMSTFFCLPESYQRPDSAAMGLCWGEEVARDLLHAAGFHVLGLTRATAVAPKTALSMLAEEELRRRAVYMCQKPYEGNPS